jgi:hypothetical protein
MTAQNLLPETGRFNRQLLNLSDLVFFPIFGVLFLDF